jgi:hypothetical protein
MAVSRGIGRCRDGAQKKISPNRAKMSGVQALSWLSTYIPSPESLLHRGALTLGRIVSCVLLNELFLNLAYYHALLSLV